MLPGGRTNDLLGTPARVEQWLARRALAPADAGLAEVCATQLRALRLPRHAPPRHRARRARPGGHRRRRRRPAHFFPMPPA
ncbi:ABATE domain-containing protein [Streptomyces qaidamensis]|uniref:ABATE domain-containing protein n=1 Tax=Streptomyces qaidamensis TaxID=1783515 RepID=UPI0036492BC6